MTRCKSSSEATPFASVGESNMGRASLRRWQVRIRGNGRGVGRDNGSVRRLLNHGDVELERFPRAKDLEADGWSDIGLGHAVP